jgi:hypothetical protein
LATRSAQFPVEPRRAQRSYPWDEWTDGSSYTLVRGVDFDIELEVFRNKLYAQAKKRGLRVHTHAHTWLRHGTMLRCQHGIRKGENGSIDTSRQCPADWQLEDGGPQWPEVLEVQFFGHAAH